MGAADAADTEILGLDVGDPVFATLRITTDRVGPFEMTFSIMRGDCYETSSTLHSS